MSREKYTAASVQEMPKEHKYLSICETSANTMYICKWTERYITNDEIKDSFS